VLPEVQKKLAKDMFNVMTIRAFVAVVPLLASLASCAGSGLYNMSDEWCTKHLDASAARCPENQAAAHRTAAASTPSSQAPEQ
jgi:hypothetical protein